MKTCAATAIAAILSAGTASAAITFDLTGPSGQASSYSYSDATSGISVVATAVREIFNRDRVTRDGSGLGVTGPLDTDLDLDGQVDEALIFTFSEVVKAGLAFFTDVDTNDDWDIFVDDGSGSFTQVGFDVDDNPFAFGWTEAKRIAIGADGGNDSFRVNSLTVAAVPLPAAGLVMIVGLGGLGLAFRRKAA